MSNSDQGENTRSSRRKFLKTSVAAVGGAVAAGALPGAYAAGSDTIRIGVIGCGERGTGAVDNALNSAPGVKLVVMGDVFKDHLETSLDTLKKTSAIADKVDVPEDRRFVGFDAYQKVLEQELDYVILATPPGFRAAH